LTAYTMLGCRLHGPLKWLVTTFWYNNLKAELN